jgi:ABC-type Fe3+/spermidine/putrescine transport system ATPase subunit
MNHGRIEQVGTPSAIYNEPASRFVADFIGTSNLIDGVVVASSSGQVVLRAAAGGEFSAVGSAPAGTKGALCVRPEKIDIVASDSPGARAATVERALRISGLMEYAVRLAEGPALVVQEQQRHGVPARTPGTAVGLMLRAEHGRFLPD